MNFATGNGRENNTYQAAKGHGARIQLEGLSKFYGTVGANRNVDLDISPGEILTLLGPSGSGNTTALMMIAGFAIPTSGDIRINGQSIV